MKVYGSKISYYTGKLEAYLRYRGLSYELLPTVGNEKKLKAGAGVVQMPVVEMDDGRWMTDTTPILAWMDGQYEAGSIYPKNGALNFLALLIEDYADEWLWRPAMHYRWSYPVSRVYASEILYRELVKGTLPLPRFLALRLLRRRQRRGFVKGDGVNTQTQKHVEQGYFKVLDCLQSIFEARPFTLGARPTIADFGMMAPMFRHFSLDPDPAEIMRARAPAVFEWVARMWDLGEPEEGTLVEVNAPLLQPLLREISETHLVQLSDNAFAYSSGARRFSQNIQNCQYKNMPVSRYRVWCLEALRRVWAGLSVPDQETLKSVLDFDGSPVLWGELDFKPSDYDTDRKAPFNKAINVYGSGIPGSK